MLPGGLLGIGPATYSLLTCNRLLGGANAQRMGIASAHYAVGRNLDEGVSQYVALTNRSWHAGRFQRLRWDGRPSTNETKGARACIGIETVSLGFERKGVQADSDWIEAAIPSGRQVLRVQPWTDEQIVMMATVGKEVIARWPRVGPRDHHGHHDLCPTYKRDVVGFPFARVLRAIYDNHNLPDVWSEVWLPEGRQRALYDLGFEPGPLDGNLGSAIRGGVTPLPEGGGLGGQRLVDYLGLLGSSRYAPEHRSHLMNLTSCGDYTLSQETSSGAHWTPGQSHSFSRLIRSRGVWTSRIRSVNLLACLDCRRTPWWGDVEIRLARPEERLRWDRLMAEGHELGFLRFVGRGLRYVAALGTLWVALAGWQAGALKCRPRDRFIGWKPCAAV